LHNGSRATLEQVIEFYNRGGDRRGTTASNTSRFGPNASNLDPDIKPLGLTAAEVADLTAFLKRPLTDSRVEWERAPFDHPSLPLPSGHVGNETTIAGQISSNEKIRKRAQDVDLKIEAVGRGGRTVQQGPILPFHDLLK